MTWTTSIENKLSEIGMRGSFLVKDRQAHTKAFIRMKDIFHQGAFSDIQNVGSKLRTYSIFKTEIGLEQYLTEITSIKDRTNLTKLRLSNHPLMIEKGRHLGITDPNLRYCPFCPGQIEDECHFLLECKSYSKLRNDLFYKTGKTVISFTYANKSQKFDILMTNTYLSSLTAQYTTKALELRRDLLENQQEHTRR